MDAESAAHVGLPAQAGSHESPKENRVASAFRRKSKRRALLIQLICAPSPFENRFLVNVRE